MPKRLRKWLEKARGRLHLSSKAIIRRSYQVFSDVLYRPLIRPTWFWRKNQITIIGLLIAFLTSTSLSSAVLNKYFEVEMLQLRNEYQEIHRQVEIIRRFQDRIEKLERQVKKITTERAKLKALGGTTVPITGYPVGRCDPISLLFPIKGGKILQYWSLWHPALDIPATYGTPIYAAANGMVAFANWTGGGYGIAVFTNTGGGGQLRYAHLSRTDLNVGDYVRKGGLIGYVGKTGNASGTHLHFELLCSGERLNPLKYL